MKLCIDCYKKWYGDISQLVTVANNKGKCEKCGRTEYLIVKDYCGTMILDDFVNPFEKKKE